MQTVFQQKYDPIVDGLEQLSEHIRLGDAFQAIDERNQQLEEKMEMLHSVAQLGITLVDHIVVADNDAVSLAQSGSIPQHQKHWPL